MSGDIRYFLQHHKSIVFWGSQLFIWSFYFIFDVEVIHRYSYRAFHSVELQIYIMPLLFCFFGLPLTLIIKLLIDKFFDRHKSALLFWIAGLVVPVILGNIWYLFGQLLENIFGKSSGYVNPLVDYFWNVFIACMILITWGAIYLFITFRDDWLKEKQKAEQALLLAENAKLKMLRYQVNPHFLFNTLSSLRAMIRNDQEQAIDMVGKISEFMRYSLVNKNEIMVPLGEEIQAARTYIEIEKIRFGEKLNIIFKAEDSVLNYLVPGFILHPVIENAIKYGMETSKIPLKVSVSAENTGNSLNIFVTNSGKWLPENNNLGGTGTGLKNIRERLSYLYPGRHRFEIKTDLETVTVQISILNPDNGNKIQSSDN